MLKVYRSSRENEQVNDDKSEGLNTQNPHWANAVQEMKKEVRLREK